jgi:hypothetical protein
MVCSPQQEKVGTGSIKASTCPVYIDLRIRATVSKIPALNRHLHFQNTTRSGTNNIDALDYVEMFLEDEGQTNPDDLNDQYVLVNFRPVVTKQN